jgi:thiol-disulfide isomerase/thioredoxin
MLRLFFTVIVTIVVFISSARSQTNDPAAELHALEARLDAKLKAGKNTEADYADEIKAIDVFTARERSADPTNAAEASFFKARVYQIILPDDSRPTSLLRQVTNDFPQTPFGERAGLLLQMIDQYEAEEKALAEMKRKQEELLAPCKPFPDFSEQDLDGKPLSVGALKGKVVLVDFWATWCVLCRIELPNVIATYQKHHAEGLEIVGVSLDDHREILNQFLKDTDGMTWPEYFDGKHWENKLAQKYLVIGLPFNVLVRRDGKIIGTSLKGPALEAAITAALAGNK